LHGNVRVPEDDRIGLREPASQPLEPPPRRSSVVNQADPDFACVEGPAFRQLRAYIGGIDVSVDRGHVTEPFELAQDTELDEVAGVHDQVSRSQVLDARVRQLSVATRQVGVGDDCDTH